MSFIGGNLLRWIDEFLVGRTQSVLVDGTGVGPQHQQGPGRPRESPKESSPLDY